MSSISHAKATFPAAFQPPPDLTVSQWADEFRRLSAEASAEPGRWDTNRAPYQRGILDALNDPDVHTIVIMSSAQIGKTEILLNIIGYFVDQDPSPMLCLQPTLDMAEAFSKDRLAPMVRDTPALRGKIADARSRDSGNTLLHKKFPGGHITMAGANSPASLASRPIRVVLCDEVDRYPVSAAAEGDPVNLARKRTTTFWNRKVLLTSTPTVKGMSRIETAYLGSDQRRYHVSCPHCGERAPLSWDRVQWKEDAPRDAAVVCQSCGAAWSEADRLKALACGEWIASHPFDGIAGFHLSEIYSPWSSPGQMAVAFLEAKHGGTEMLQTWVNTSLGETWEEQGEQVSEHALMARVEKFPDALPAGVHGLTLGADVQGDRIEYEIVGWNAEEESWSIEDGILAGDPVQDYVWNDLATVIRARYAHESGAQMSILQACVDAGYQTKRVQEFCRKMGAHVVPVIGRPGAGRPVIVTGRQRLLKLRQRRSNDAKSEVVGVDDAKAIIYRRLMIEKPGPGYCHFPDDRDQEYFSQLTAEKLILKFRKGQPYREWVKTRERNEALDCRVYAYAALLLAGVDRLTPPQPPQNDKPKLQHMPMRPAFSRPLIR